MGNQQPSRYKAEGSTTNSNECSEKRNVMLPSGRRYSLFRLKYSERDGIKVEQGTNALHNVLVQPILTWADWKKVVRQLVKEKDKLKNKIQTV